MSEHKFNFQCDFCSGVHIAVLDPNVNSDISFSLVESTDDLKFENSGKFIYTCPNDEDDVSRTVELDFTAEESKLLKNAQLVRIE